MTEEEIILYNERQFIGLVRKIAKHDDNKVRYLTCIAGAAMGALAGLGCPIKEINEKVGKIMQDWVKELNLQKFNINLN